MNWLVIASAIVLFVASFVVGDWHRWQPSRFPVDLAVRSFRSHSFHVDFTGTYLIELEVDRKGDFSKVSCMLGVNPGPADACDGTESVVEIKWELQLNNQAVAIGTAVGHGDGVWGESIGRILGEFIAEPGHQYALQISSIRNAAVLAPYNPRIVISVHPARSKSNLVVAEILLMLGTLLLLIGGILFGDLTNCKRKVE